MSLNVLVSHYGSDGSYLQTCLPFISTHTHTHTHCTHPPPPTREGGGKKKEKKRRRRSSKKEKSNGRVDERGQWSRWKRWIMARPQDWNKSPVDDSIMCSHRGAVHCRLLCNLLKSHSLRTQPMKWEFNYVYHSVIDIIAEKDFCGEPDPAEKSPGFSWSWSCGGAQDLLWSWFLRGLLKKLLHPTLASW